MDQQTNATATATEHSVPLRPAPVLPSRIDRPEDLVSALHDFAPAEVRKLLLAAGPGEWKKWMPQFYRQWGALDGAAAIKSALEEENALVSRAAGAVLDAWAESDLPAAQAWVESAPSGRAQVSFANIVIKSIESPREAATWLAQLNPDAVSNLSDAVSRISQRWIAVDPLAALNWLSSRPEDKMREKALMQTFFQWSKTNPEAASGFLAQLDPQEAFYSLAAEGLARAISVTDAEGALAWADQVDHAQRERSGLDNMLLIGAKASLGEPTRAYDGEIVESAPSPLSQ